MRKMGSKFTIALFLWNCSSMKMGCNSLFYLKKVNNKDHIFEVDQKKRSFSTYLFFTVQLPREFDIGVRNIVIRRFLISDLKVK